MNHKQQIHNWILQFRPLDLCIDMTAGNGHDTYFLALNSKKVITIDIQENAIQNTQKRCEDFDNIEYLVINHDKFNIKTKISGVMYNLGYLPGSDKSIITSHNSTIASLNNLINNIDKFITISCYRKHSGGNDEYIAVKQWVDTLPYQVDLLEYETELSPVTFLINMTKTLV